MEIIKYVIFVHETEFHEPGKVAENETYFKDHPDRLLARAERSESDSGCMGQFLISEHTSLAEAEAAFEKAASPSFYCTDVNGCQCLVKWFTLEREEWEDDDIMDGETLRMSFPGIDEENA